MDTSARDAILRSLLWTETIGVAPTRAELFLNCDVGTAIPRIGRTELADAFDALRNDGTIAEQAGRVGFPASLPRILERIRERDPFQPRKRRRGRRVARWLSILPGVRFVALANTTALGVARDAGDLDFFVVVRAGTIWTTRLVAVLPFRVLGMTPKGEEGRDAVCLSYFIADDALDLSSHQIAGDDPYFRHWFLSLLPLFDDGVSDDLWAANATLRRRHPCAEKWIVPPDLRVDPGIRFPFFVSRLFEPAARRLQTRWFPPAIRERMNRDTTVIVDDHVLKFHVTDGRDAYRRTYYDLCRTRGIAS